MTVMIGLFFGCRAPVGVGIPIKNDIGDDVSLDMVELYAVFVSRGHASWLCHADNMTYLVQSADPIAAHVESLLGAQPRPPSVCTR